MAMASNGGMRIGPDGREPGESLRIERVDRDRVRVLNLLLTGEATASGLAVSQFLNFADQQKLDVRELWAGYRHDQPVAATLIVPSPGRTAMAFIAPTDDRDKVPANARVMRAACNAQDPAKIRLVQALLEPGQLHESHSLLDAGYTMLAQLVYMHMTIDRPGVALNEPLYDRYSYSDKTHELFTRAVLASYEGTMDCPGLLGLRKIEDIIAGHMATGRFDPSLWTALYEGDEPAAVMLLAEIPPRDAMELVYLGVSQTHRSRGLGGRLLAHAIHEGSRRKLNTMMLAVDEHNAPAMKLYRRVGFASTARKTAMIKTLGE